MTVLGVAKMFDPEWAEAQTNRPLQNEEDVGYAYVASLQSDVRFHRERWKNWDNYLAVYHCLNTCSRHLPVLDAGACRDPKYPSAFLPTLADHGFTRLLGCNLDEPKGVVTHENGVHYQHADITDTTFEEDKFGFIACLSTIEHGVPVLDFLDEMYRILKPGGHLFVSFDYWQNHIDTKGVEAFGVPIKIFDLGATMDMCEYARRIGFTHSKVNYSCGDPLVKWMGFEYTFMNLLFHKPGPARYTGC